jgi:hypothetical protein
VPYFAGMFSHCQLVWLERENMLCMFFTSHLYGAACLVCQTHTLQQGCKAASSVKKEGVNWTGKLHNEMICNERVAHMPFPTRQIGSG